MTMKLSWTLTRYARFSADRKGVARKANTSGQVQTGVWKNWSTSNGQFNLSLSETGQLLITQGDICLENVLLSNSKEKLKMLAKGDSMLFAVKLKLDVRRFRVMFAEVESQSLSSEQACIDCTTAVRKFFPVRTVRRDGGTTMHDTDPGDSQISVTDATPPQQEIEGAVSLSKMAELLTSGDLTRLPSAYQVAPALQTDAALSRLVKWCLLDPEFPSFVQQVETELKKISQESINQ